MKPEVLRPRMREVYRLPLLVLLALGFESAFVAAGNEAIKYRERQVELDNKQEAYVHYFAMDVVYAGREIQWHHEPANYDISNLTDYGDATWDEDLSVSDTTTINGDLIVTGKIIQK